MLSITTIPAAQLNDQQISDWARIQEADSDLASPYFRPEFTQAVAAVRPDVEVALLADRGETIGYFPYQRRRRAAQPAAGRLSDFHGVIARPGAAWTAEELLRGCGLSSWEFHHLLASQSQFAVHVRETEGSPYLDLTGGFEAYRAGLDKGRRESVSQVLRKGRKFERECGDVRFELDCRDPAVLERLLAWKSSQYRRTGLTDVFAYEWTMRLVKEIWRKTGPAFSGLLSAMYVKDQPVAAHFGMRSHGVLHYWFPAYDPEFGRFSPGAILIMEIAQAADAAGISRIDLGRGSEQAKTTIMSGATPVTEGLVHCRSVAGLARRCWRATRERFRASPLRRHLEWPLRITRPMREWMAFR